MSEFMNKEIREQPVAQFATLEKLSLLATEIDEIFEGNKQIIFIARGTSDNVSNYGSFAFPILAQRQAFSISPSLLNNYSVRPDLSDSVVIAISQSGETNEIVSATEITKQLGAQVVSITNTPGSTLSQISDLGFVTPAGTEVAVPATKSYSTALIAMAWFAASAAKADEFKNKLLEVPASVAKQLEGSHITEDIVSLLSSSKSAVFAGRGIAMGSALEAALKLKETCGINASGMSVADLVHGPIAALNSEVPLIVLSGSRKSPIYSGVVDLMSRAENLGAPIITFGDFEQAHESKMHIAIKSGDPEELISPLLFAAPLQTLALKVAESKGLNPDEPNGLKKITETA